MDDMQVFLNRAEQWIHAHSEEMIEEIQRLAQIRSVSRADLAEEGAPFGPECREMLDFALERARTFGFETENHAGYCGSAILGDGENAIGIFAHLDVVPEGDKWIYPPYAATRLGDFLIGRGVSDNKSPAVMAMFLMRMFREMGTELKHGIRLVFGCAEETGMQDIKYFAENVTQPIVSLIPDSAFPANYAQKGSMSGRMRIDLGEQITSFVGGEVPNMVPPHATAVLSGISADALTGALAASGAQMSDFEITGEGDACRVKASGVAAHAAHPEGGKSAIHLLALTLANSGILAGQSEKAARAIAEVSKDYTGANAGIALEDPDTGITTMNVGTAATEDGRVTLSLDCRLSIAADLASNVSSFELYAKSLGFETFRMNTTPPVYMPKDDPRVVALQKVYQDVTGEPREPYTMGGGTYSRVLKNAITFGPGLPDMTARPDGLPEGHGGAHAPDEYMYIPNFLKAAAIYACAIVALDELV